MNWAMEKLNKLKEIFIHSDAKSIRQMLVNDVVIPGIKDGLYKGFSNRAALVIYGSIDKKPQTTTATKSSSSTTTYSYRVESNNGMKDIPDPKFGSRIRAKNVLFLAQDAINTTGKITVKEFYNLLHVENGDDEYGWDSYEDMVLAQGNGEWFIHLPPAKKLGG